MEKLKIWQWLEDLNAWAIYDDKSLRKEFKEKTGKEPSWFTETIREVNKTYGQLKGVLKPLKGKPDTKTADGWRVAFGLWKKYCNKGNCGGYIGRGFTFDCCLEELRKRNI